MKNVFLDNGGQNQSQNVRTDGEFKCNGCGANMTYDADAQKLKCPYCGFGQEIEKNTNVVERDFEELKLRKFDDSDRIKKVTCQNCGATEILNQDAVSTKCPFCDSPLVIDTKDVDIVKPDSLLPFAFGQSKAKESCIAWIKKRWFAKREFKRNLKLGNPQGMYFPVWTFDSHTCTRYEGRLGKDYTVHKHGSDGKTHTETRIRWFPVHGDRNDFFDDVLINASSFVRDDVLKKLQPFPKQNYVVYSSEYLAGYFANSYIVQPLDAFESAQEKMYQSIKSRIISSYHADHVGYLNMDVRHVEKSFKSLYLPAYLSRVKFKDKYYCQFINGATGKIVGEYPKSVGKILCVVLASLGLLALLVWLIIKFGA